MNPTHHYTVVEISGAWEIHHRPTGEAMSRILPASGGRVKVVRTYYVRAVAEAYARAWNEDRHPTAAELSAALCPAA